MTFLLKSGGFSNSLHGNSESLLGSNSNSNTVQSAVATDAKSLHQTCTDNTIKESALPKVVKILKSQDIHLQSASAPDSIQDPSVDDVDQSSTISSLSGSGRPEWKMNNDVDNLIIKTEDDGGPSCIQIKSVTSLNPASIASESSYQHSVNDGGDDNEIENSWNKSDGDGGSRDAIHGDSSSNDVDANDNKTSISKLQEFDANSYENPTTNPHPYKKSAASLPFQRVNFEKITSTSPSRSPSVSRKRTSLPRPSSYVHTPPPPLHTENDPVAKFDPIMGTYYSCPDCENKFFTAECVQEHLPSCSGTPTKNYSTRSDRKKNRRADFQYESDYDSDSDDSNIVTIDDDDDPPLKRQLRNRTRVSKSYKCGMGLCMRVFDNEDDLYKHRRTSHPDPTKSKARNRPGPKSKKSKTAEDTFSCNFCDELFLLKSTLEEHEKKSHVNEYPYVCDVCADCFSSEPDLNSHKDEHHPDPASNSSSGFTNGDSPSPSSKDKQRNEIRNRMKQKNESLSGNITAYVELD